MNLKDLVGAKMVAAWEHGGDLFFVTDKGTFQGTPYGDCCASCYVQHISGAEALAEGAEVLEVEDIELPAVEDPVEVSDVWGHKLKTTKGYCTIEMRVDHNGYYGGSLDWSACDGGIPKDAKPLEDF